MSANLHIYPAPIVNESRIFRQTAAVASESLFERVVICGQQAQGLPRMEAVGPRRTIERVGVPVDERPRSLIGRIREQIAWSVGVYRAWRTRSVRVVNAHSVAVLPVSYAVARRHHASLIYDTHELETKTSTSGGLQGTLFRLVERFYIRRCDVVFVVNESIAQWYRDTYPGVRVIAIHNAPSMEGPTGRVDLREKHGIPHRERVYVHVGNIVEHRFVPEILQAFAAREGSGDHIVFIGSGALEGAVREYAERHSNIHLHGAVPADSVVNTAAGGDLGLCLIEPTCLSYALSLPNKALEYAKAGIPFFYTDLVEVDRLLGAEFLSWKVRPTIQALTDSMTGLQMTDIEAGRDALAEVSLPEWGREAARMLDEYRRILETP